ncbi:MAG: sigma 54-interacting transcriptional regulator [Myxococcaceae bacterium]|nr:sigma 54-interacting transcriptional regulator [Myxococcaceae bacterium]
MSYLLQPIAVTDAGQTQSSTTASSIPARPVARPRLLGLALVLDCGHLDTGGELFVLDRVSRVVLGRGDRRAMERTHDTGRWTLTDPKLSSTHAVVQVEGGSVLVEDQGSRNGIFIRDQRVDRARVLPGESFRAGDSFFLLVDDVEPVRPSDRPLLPTFHGAFARELDRLQKLAVSPLPLLLMGETGSGKEVLAQAIHARSGRPGAFLPVNCGAIPDGLVEAHFFGHDRGAFSGAVRDEPGLVRRAAGGTLFLDEIGDLPLSAQAALLRVLQGGEVTSVGSSRPERVDVRVLAATHRDLESMVKAGQFRADLYARLAGFVARTPPLRERRADLGLLIASFIADGRLPPIRMEREAAARLLDYDWPYNVRELLQAMQAAAALAGGEPVRASHLPETVRAGTAPRPGQDLSPEDRALRDELIRRMRERNGNITQVARDMGKARQQIQRWIRRFDLPR